MRRDDRAILLDIATAGRLVGQFREGIAWESFVGDLKTQSAIIHQLLIIGEAVKRLSDGFRAAHPAIPWADIARMRDKLIHHYEELNAQEVWRAAEKDVPALLAALEPMLPVPPAGHEKHET